MAENSKISLAAHTWNPWMLPSGRKANDRYWRLPGKWQRAALKSKERHRICLAPDPFEEFSGPIVDVIGRILELHPSVVPAEHIDCPYSRMLTLDDLRRDMFDVIDQTPNLDYLLLTKRPENIREMTLPWLRDRMGSGRESPDNAWQQGLPIPNVWLLYSASDQETLEAGIDHLVECRHLSPVLGVSLEPMIGPVDLSQCLSTGLRCSVCNWAGSELMAPRHDFDDEPDGWACPECGEPCWHVPSDEHIDWVIVGGESGPLARPCQIEWILDIVQQCAAAGVACYVKQWGSNPCVFNPDPGSWDGRQDIALDDKKGADPSEWSEEMRVQQHPKVTR